MNRLFIHCTQIVFTALGDIFLRRKLPVFSRDGVSLQACAGQTSLFMRKKELNFDYFRTKYLRFFKFAF